MQSDSTIRTHAQSSRLWIEGDSPVKTRKECSERRIFAQYPSQPGVGHHDFKRACPGRGATGRADPGRACEPIEQRSQDVETR